MMKNRFFQAKRFTLFLLVSYLFSACAAQSPALYQADLQKAYHSAIVDAEKAEPSEISHNLVAIVPSNEKLVMYDEEFKQINAVIEKLLREANAKVIFLVDKNGQLITA